VLLLDEPTNGLDERTTECIVDLLIASKETMLIVSHDPDFRAAVGTRHIHLEGGKIAQRASMRRSGPRIGMPPFLPAAPHATGRGQVGVAARPLP
jgi:cobalt/nickel transport system ATP-binding protein